MGDGALPCRKMGSGVAPLRVGEERRADLGGNSHRVPQISVWGLFGGKEE